MSRIRQTCVDVKSLLVHEVFDFEVLVYGGFSPQSVFGISFKIVLEVEVGFPHDA